MDAQNISHPDVTFALHRDEAAGRYLFGAVVDGEFVPLGEHKLGRIDKLLRAATARRKSQPQQGNSSTEPQQPQQ